MSAPCAGDPAPDFELQGTDGPFRLSEQRGRRVVLLFYPGDNTAVCTKQFCSYRDRAEDMASLDAVVVGISKQGIDSHDAWMSKHNLSVPLLSDPDGAVAKAYGVAAPGIGTRRAVFVVDENGDVREKKVHLVGLRYESVEDLRGMLEAG